MVVFVEVYILFYFKISILEVVPPSATRGSTFLWSEGPTYQGNRNTL